jgi:hypothetical protein
MHCCRPNGRRERQRAYDYHLISKQRPIDPEQLTALHAAGWELFSTIEPVSPDDRKYDYHFRRAIDPGREWR